MTDPVDADDPDSGWERFYRETDRLPWETGDPQPAVVERARGGDVVGRVLDVGCGVGTEARFLARRGHDVVGVDIAETAVERARERTEEGFAAAVDSDLAFRVADAFALSAADLGTFDTAVDVGLLHTFGPEERSAYTDALASVVRSGGRVVCLSFGADAPDDWGPNPLSAAEVRASFGAGWTVDVVDAAPFETRQGAVPGVLAVLERR